MKQLQVHGGGRKYVIIFDQVFPQGGKFALFFCLANIRNLVLRKRKGCQASKQGSQLRTGGVAFAGFRSQGRRVTVTRQGLARPFLDANNKLAGRCSECASLDSEFKGQKPPPLQPRAGATGQVACLMMVHTSLPLGERAGRAPRGPPKTNFSSLLVLLQRSPNRQGRYVIWPLLWSSCRAMCEKRQDDQRFGRIG